MIDIEIIKDYLKSYDGQPLTFMEVCGTHTAAINENAIPSLLSDKIRLISGPGCPVCVTVSGYIDRLIELSNEEDTCVVTFGDMIRVPGSEKSLLNSGGNFRMIYSPLETIRLAKAEPQTLFVFAAVGFETTAPVYALLLDEIIRQDIKNIRLLTAIKTMPAAISALCEIGVGVNGFIAPGNVSVITGSDVYRPLAEKYRLPFAVSGFSGEELLCGIYSLVRLHDSARVVNLYNAVTPEGNKKAQALLYKYFEPCDAVWRGMGIIENSGLALKNEYSRYDLGSRRLTADKAKNSGCKCGEVITGKLSPSCCPLYSKACTPENPQGACMVSGEGACRICYMNEGE